jgi:hypothetical protein
MTRDQVVDLLTAISAYDNRKPNPAAVLAWGKAAELGRWTLPEALEAVHGHFSEDPAYLMPAHVTARVKAARQDRALRDEALAIEAGPVHPEVAARVEKVVAEIAAGMGWDRENRGSKFGLQVVCPHCGAGLGAKCTQPKTGQTLRESAMHPARAEAIAQQLRGEQAS